MSIDDEIREAERASAADHDDEDARRLEAALQDRLEPPAGTPRCSTCQRWTTMRPQVEPGGETGPRPTELAFMNLGRGHLVTWVCAKDLTAAFMFRKHEPPPLRAHPSEDAIDALRAAIDGGNLRFPGSGGLIEYTEGRTAP